MDRGGETGTYGAAQPIERLDRLDVDAARDRVGTVDCRRTVLQDFNAIDHALRHRVEVDEIAEAALAYTVDPALPVDENEDPVAAAFDAAEIAQVDRAALGRATCRERGCPYVIISEAAVSVKKTQYLHDRLPRH